MPRPTRPLHPVCGIPGSATLQALRSRSGTSGRYCADSLRSHPVAPAPQRIRCGGRLHAQLRANPRLAPHSDDQKSLNRDLSRPRDHPGHTERQSGDSPEDRTCDTPLGSTTRSAGSGRSPPRHPCFPSEEFTSSGLFWNYGQNRGTLASKHCLIFSLSRLGCLFETRTTPRESRTRQLSERGRVAKGTAKPQLVPGKPPEQRVPNRLPQKESPANGLGARGAQVSWLTAPPGSSRRSETTRVESAVSLQDEFKG